jgi:hypothetical protein
MNFMKIGSPMQEESSCDRMICNMNEQSLMEVDSTRTEDQR